MPKHRFMSAFEQHHEAPDKNWQFLIFAAEPYETIAFKVPSREVDKTEEKFWTHWNKETKQFFLQVSFKWNIFWWHFPPPNSGMPWTFPWRRAGRNFLHEPSERKKLFFFLPFFEFNKSPLLFLRGNSLNRNGIPPRKIERKQTFSWENVHCLQSINQSITNTKRQYSAKLGRFSTVFRAKNHSCVHYWRRGGGCFVRKITAACTTDDGGYGAATAMRTSWSLARSGGATDRLDNYSSWYLQIKNKKSKKDFFENQKRFSRKKTKKKYCLRVEIEIRRVAYRSPRTRFASVPAPGTHPWYWGLKLQKINCRRLWNFDVARWRHNAPLSKPSTVLVASSTAGAMHRGPISSVPLMIFANRILSCTNLCSFALLTHAVIL